MSDLQEIRTTLHRLTEQLAGAAAIVELDADAMRQAILDALSIYSSALAGQKYGAEVDERDAQAMASAASRMAERLRELHRVRVSSEPVEVEL